MRKHTLEYDDVMNLHRSEVYAYREKIIEEKDIFPLAGNILSDFTSIICKQFKEEYSMDKTITMKRLNDLLMAHFPISISEEISPQSMKRPIK